MNFFLLTNYIVGGRGYFTIFFLLHHLLIASFFGLKLRGNFQKNTPNEFA